MRDDAAAARLAAAALVSLAAAASFAVPACRPRESGDGTRSPLPSVEARGALLVVPPAPAAGLRLTLGPNLPGVSPEDVPDAATREVEILGYDGKGLRLRWTAVVHLESAASSRRREDWVKSVSSAPSGATPPVAVPPQYESKEISGVLDLPDFATATTFLLPGLWPEGAATVRETAALWLPPPFRRLLGATGNHAPMSLLPAKGLVLRDPAASLLARAAQIDRERANRSGEEPPPGVWTRADGESRVALRVDGRDGAAAAFRARDWFGWYEVLDRDRNPLVVGVWPEPVSVPLESLFAPVRVLKTLLSYRILAIDSPPARKAGS